MNISCNISDAEIDFAFTNGDKNKDGFMSKEEIIQQAVCSISIHFLNFSEISKPNSWNFWNSS